ncbi:MAG: 3-hydroxyacyl-CoA dehydrogenase NAD-binding domain-containing protein [Thermodesulfobacteriota bacterium]|nr:3-hydroxyacyl-CoA dehydrogenase NAD-binding domain-containing protein [Thermodesulfobacteriota bacterium]
MKVDDIKKIAVIGSGAMGHGIAQVSTVAGYQVVMVDVKQEFLDNGVAKIKESLDFLVGKGKISADDKDNILNNLLTTSLDAKEAVADVQLVIEAVPEIMDLKKKVFADVSAGAPADAILASNTSTMSITEIASAASNPERFVGMHFFNPVNRMKLVEVIYGKQTSDETVDTLCEVSKRINKVPVKVLKDSPGFIVNRIGAPNQALISAVLDEGKIKPDSVDTVMKEMGMPMGPFELADYVGIDVFYHTLKYYSETLSKDFTPGKTLQGLLDSGDLGMKTGKGIYTWEGGKAQIDTSNKSDEITPMEFLSIQINEAVRVYKEGIAESVEDIDQGMVHGMRAFAGPFALTAGIEPQQLTDALNKLKDRYGLEIFTPEPEIVDGSFKTMGK